MDIDLNIENYDLDDLLNLFSLEKDFDGEDLKRCKRVVCKTHPDKSKLPKEYFIFFGKAYKIIHKIYEFKRSKIDNKITEYEYYVDEYDNNNKEDISNKIKKDNFNEWFNKMFLKYNINDDLSNGYGDWIREVENEGDIKCNKSNLNDTFENLKLRKMDKIVVHRDIRDVCNGISSGESEIVANNNFYGNGDIFSKNLNYEDLKVAHTETYIPVTNKDYEKKKKYNSVFELNQDRGSQNINPLTKEESEEYFRKKESIENNIANKNAYYLLKKEEESKKNNLEFMRNLQLLK